MRPNSDIASISRFKSSNSQATFKIEFCTL